MKKMFNKLLNAIKSHKVIAITCATVLVLTAIAIPIQLNSKNSFDVSSTPKDTPTNSEATKDEVIDAAGEEEVEKVPVSIIDDSDDEPATPKPTTPNKKPTSNKKPSSNTKKSPSKNTPTTYEESEKKIKERSDKYIKEHGIDPATAGETGAICPHCGKKLWDPNKYGDSIPGDPKGGFGNPNSKYCSGWCSVIIE